MLEASIPPSNSLRYVVWVQDAAFGGGSEDISFLLRPCLFSTCIPTPAMVLVQLLYLARRISSAGRGIARGKWPERCGRSAEIAGSATCGHCSGRGSDRPRRGYRLGQSRKQRRRAAAGGSRSGPSQLRGARKRPLIPLDDALSACDFQVASELRGVFGGAERADHGAIVARPFRRDDALDNRRAGAQYSRELACSAR